MTEKTIDVDVWEEQILFPSCVYKLYKPNFLDSLKNISEKYMNPVREVQRNEIFPVYMSPNYVEDEEIHPFKQYVLDTAWNIFKEQGYNMDNMSTYFTSLFTQEHYKHSLMEEHTHGWDSQLNAFYFLEVPKKSGTLCVHDPRVGKLQIDLMENDRSKLTVATRQVHFTPQPGDLFFTNSYVPHSISRHADKKPLVFIHMNIIVGFNANKVKVCCAPVIV